MNDPKQTKNVGINPYGNIYFIAHGYIDSGDRPWVNSILFKCVHVLMMKSFPQIEDMTNALLDEDPTGTATVIVVDWGGGMYRELGIEFLNFIYGISFIL